MVNVGRLPAASPAEGWALAPCNSSSRQRKGDTLPSLSGTSAVPIPRLVSLGRSEGLHLDRWCSTSNGGGRGAQHYFVPLQPSLLFQVIGSYGWSLVARHPNLFPAKGHSPRMFLRDLKAPKPELHVHHSNLWEFQHRLDSACKCPRQASWGRSR